MKDLRIAGVGKAFGPQPVLRGVELAVPAGSFTAILGSSGSGKTTLLRIVAGFERPDEGEVRLGGEVVDDANHRFVPSERRRIGYVPQEGALFPHLSVGRNVAFGLPRGPDRRRRVDELLELVGLSGYRRRYPHQLSGGQQQRVALARALAVGPEFVLLDEPFASLDAAMRSSVRTDVLAVLRQAGSTSILVTHDQDEALSMADQVAVLREGVIAQVDTPTALYGRPGDVELARFLGESNVLEGEVHDGTARTALGRLSVAQGRGPRRMGRPESWSGPSRSGWASPRTAGSWPRCRPTSTTATMPWCGSGPMADPSLTWSCGSTAGLPSSLGAGSGSRCSETWWCGHRSPPTGGFPPNNAFVTTAMSSGVH